MSLNNLIIVTAGDNSVHKRWIGGSNFDIAVIYYGNQKKKYFNDCKYYFELNEPKWKVIYSCLEQCNYKEYKNFWFPDDDVVLAKHEVEQLFDVFEEFKLDLAQPSLKDRSAIHHWITEHQDTNKAIRYTSFVEIMCPLFNSEALEKCKFTFNENNTGAGLDFFWGKLLNYHNIAVIDSIQALHPYRRNNTSINFMRSRGYNSDYDIKQLFEKYQLDNKVWEI